MSKHGRLIDADALMEILTTAIRNMKGMAKFIGAEDDPEIQMAIKAYTDIADGVKNMPTIEPERKTGKWIPCSEGYPEMDERVLVNLDGRYDIHVWDCMSNRDDSYFWEDEDGLFRNKYEVLYWMRIPELSGGAG